MEANNPFGTPHCILSMSRCLHPASPRAFHVTCSFNAAKSHQEQVLRLQEDDGRTSSSASQPDYLPPGMCRGLPAGLAIHGFAARQPLSEGRLILHRRLRETLTKGNALGLSAFGQCVRRRRLRVVGHLCATSESRYRDTLQLASRPTAFRLPDREAIMETERVPRMSNREIQVGIL